VTLDLRENLVAFPLGPRKVVVRPVLEVAHAPPEALLESGADQNRIVAAPYIILVRRERRVGELQLVTIRLVHAHQELAVMLLLKLQVLLFVFRIGQVLCQLLHLREQALQSVQDRFRLALPEVIFLSRPFYNCTGWRSGHRAWRLRDPEAGLVVALLAALATLAGPKEDLVVHSALDYEQTGSYETLFEELGLEHFDQMLNSKLLRQLGVLVHQGLLLGSYLRGGHFTLPLSDNLLQLRLDLGLLLQLTHFGALLQCKLTVLAVDALGVD
jgi:hypothetical protein